MSLLPPASVFTVGNVVMPALGAALVELDIASEENRPARCRAAFMATFAGADFIDRGQLDFGRSFKVTRSGVTLFDGDILALGVRVPPGSSPLVQIIAEDALHRLAGGRRTRVFTDLSDADVVQRISLEHGLQPALEIPGPTYASVAQVGATDLDFLGERLHRLDAWMWAEGTTLRARIRRVQPAGALVATIAANLREFSVSADLRGQATALSSAGWDVHSKAGVPATATAEALGSEGQGGETAAAILLQRFSERRDGVVEPIAATGNEADALARAAYRRGARRFVTGSGVADFDGRIAVGGTLELKGLGATFSGAYLVTATRHRYDGDTGYRTEFTTERSVLGRP